MCLGVKEIKRCVWGSCFETDVWKICLEDLFERHVWSACLGAYLERMFVAHVEGICLVFGVWALYRECTSRAFDEYYPHCVTASSFCSAILLLRNIVRDVLVLDVLVRVRPAAIELVQVGNLTFA